jgi:hypothetical protein
MIGRRCSKVLERDLVLHMQAVRTERDLNHIRGLLSDLGFSEKTKTNKLRGL